MDLIIDGPSLFARNFFATYHRPATGRPDPQTGEPWALPSVSLSLRVLLNLLNPDINRAGCRFERMLLAWDLKQNSLKNRSAKPAQYYELRDIFQELCTLLFQSAHAGHEDYEADDLVATAACNTPHEAVVVSGDKDLMQLYGPRVRYYDLNQKAFLSERFIINRWHVHRPSQIAIALAIIGDPTDNIEGVSGWGPKRVQRLFETIPPNADFEESVDRAAAAIPEDLRSDFWASLDRTLLNRQVPGVPEPAPIVLAEPGIVDELDLGMDGYYRQTWQMYTN